MTGSAVIIALVNAPNALAASVVITNGYYIDPAGTYGPRHSLTKVDNNRTGGGSVCENALNNDGSWAQSYAYCTGPFGGNYVYHSFCGCQLRYGWNGPESSPANMVGIEYY